MFIIMIEIIYRIRVLNKIIGIRTDSPVIGIGADPLERKGGRSLFGHQKSSAAVDPSSTIIVYRLKCKNVW